MTANDNINDLDHCSHEDLGGMTMEDFKNAGIANLTSIQRVAASPGAEFVFLGQQKEIEDIATAILGSIAHEPR